MPTYRCRVNGRAAQLESWDPREPLLYALRSNGLDDVKIGCGLGQCGSCTVLVGGDAVRSCVVPVESIAGKTIVTIEGVGSPEKPDSVQAAFIAEQAAQCGYCTPGMILSVKALLARTPKPTVAQIKDALAGNLCRCGAHTRILRAVLRASGQRPFDSARGRPFDAAQGRL
jgi:nicotinate dehydrogenase subunit A